MKLNPNLDTDIPAYVEDMVADKHRAGMHIPQAQQSAAAQIYADAKVGLLDRDKAIEWLTAYEVGRGSTPEIAARLVGEHLSAR